MTSASPHPPRRREAETAEGTVQTCDGDIKPLVEVLGADVTVPCLDGKARPYRDLDAAASTPSSARVAAKVFEALPLYASVHRGTGFKSQMTTEAYEGARRRAMAFAGRSDNDVAILCRNTTEAINHLAYRLRLEPHEVVVTTVVEHHANLLPWGRVASRRFIECDASGTFTVEDVRAALDQTPRPALLAITGASNVTGWMPRLGEVIEVAHDRSIPVVVDAAQLAPHRPLPDTADFIAFSGHKLYAPFGAGALIGPRSSFLDGDPFLAGGGAVDLVDLDEVLWTVPPEREEAGSPNVIGALAMGEALVQLSEVGWDAITAHELALARQLRHGVAKIDGVTLLGPSPDAETLASATFLVEGAHHALVAARLSAEFGIGVRHGCFCAQPYLMRLLNLTRDDVAVARTHIRQGDRRSLPGAVRASCSLATSHDDVDAFLRAMEVISTDAMAGSTGTWVYEQDAVTGDFRPLPMPVWWGAQSAEARACATE